MENKRVSGIGEEMEEGTEGERQEEGEKEKETW